MRILKALFFPGGFDFDLEELFLVVILKGFKRLLMVRGDLVSEGLSRGKLCLKVLELGIEGV